jgi:hypothetical protein
VKTMLFLRSSLLKNYGVGAAKTCLLKNTIYLMAKSSRHLPAPQAQAFVVCREIREQSEPYEVVLLGPKCHVPIPAFPAEVELSVYAHITGGHGSYDIEITLRNAEGDSVWSWMPPKRLEHPDPLEPQQLLFQDLVVHVPRARRYELALLAGGEEI